MKTEIQQALNGFIDARVSNLNKSAASKMFDKILGYFLCNEGRNRVGKLGFQV